MDTNQLPIPPTQGICILVPRNPCLFISNSNMKIGTGFKTLAANVKWRGPGANSGTGPAVIDVTMMACADLSVPMKRPNGNNSK